VGIGIAGLGSKIGSEENDLMNKKVMAVAVAGAFAAPMAFAQTSNVQIYGRANVGIDQYQAKGAQDSVQDRQSRLRVFDGSSRVGFRGTEDLGGGLKAIFQIETGVNMDTGNEVGQNSATNSSAGTWGSRETFAGLDSNFGRLIFGRMTVYRGSGTVVQTGANYVNTDLPWSDGLSTGRIQGAFQTNPTRLSNVVHYTTPTFAGINASLYYSPTPQEAVQLSSGTTTATDTDGRIWGGTLRATYGPFYGQFDYVDGTGNSPQGPPVAGAFTDKVKARANKISLGWQYMPGANLGVVVARLTNNNGNGGVGGQAAVAGTGITRQVVTIGDGVNQIAWMVNWEHTFGNIQVLAQYGQLDKLKGCDDVTSPGGCDNSKAQGWLVGARYLFSKRTWVYFTYNAIENESNQFVDYQGGNISSVALPPAQGNAGTPYGADPRIFALGILHNF